MMTRRKQMTRRQTFLRGIICVLAVGVQVQLLRAQTPAASFAGFDKSVKPFLQKHCLQCHGPKKSEGDMRFDQLSPVVSNSDTAETWQEVLDVLNASEMPPEDQVQP